MKKTAYWQQLLLYVWVAPITIWCLPLALLAKWTGGGYAIHSGVLEIWGGWVGQRLDRGIPFLGAVNAITIGHIVAGVSPQHLHNSRVHERVHVTQFEHWGLLFPFVYFIAGIQAQQRGGSFYWDNPYEIEARTRAAAAKGKS
ncbi:MAG: hypothetical protein QJT81_10925 [Candidatus Thiothrix putei]|uniref:Signal peptide prediction n=1 Tax=Candidatus Thiothrix putei TaxID=3080811 RepID=A0AA95HAD2_9GAMM|nr:MAG: hypothetical protein QJT81_10925 [Candidatus Thiothrix putei]